MLRRHPVPRIGFPFPRAKVNRQVSGTGDSTTTPGICLQPQHPARRNLPPRKTPAWRYGKTLQFRAPEALTPLTFSARRRRIPSRPGTPSRVAGSLYETINRKIQRSCAPGRSDPRTLLDPDRRPDTCRFSTRDLGFHRPIGNTGRARDCGSGAESGGAVAPDRLPGGANPANPENPAGGSPGTTGCRAQVPRFRRRMARTGYFRR